MVDNAVGMKAFLPVEVINGQCTGRAEASSPAPPGGQHSVLAHQVGGYSRSQLTHRLMPSNGLPGQKSPVYLQHASLLVLQQHHDDDGGAGDDDGDDQPQQACQQLPASQPLLQQQPLSPVMLQPSTSQYQSIPVRHHSRSRHAPQTDRTHEQMAVEIPSLMACGQHGQAHPQASCASPSEAVSRAVSAAKLRSPLKGSSAWPPPSPRKAARSQNRKPAKASSVTHVATLQHHADVMALHQRLR